MMQIIPGAEPFFFPGGDVACLLVHGFTSSPSEMRFLGQALANHGFSVLGVRLFAHATRFQDMPRARWQDWIADIESGWHLLQGNNRPLIIIGFSLGGALSLYFSAHFPVKAVIAIAAPHHTPSDPRVPFLKVLSLFRPYLYTPGKPVWFDETERQKHIRYPNDSTRALAEVRDFLKELQMVLPKVTAPALLIYAKQDPTITVKERHMEQIYSSIGSSIKETLVLENSGHIIPLDAEREKAFHTCIQFIDRVVYRI